MSQAIKKITALLLPILLVPLLAATPVSAAPCPDVNILGFPAWYSGLQCEGTTPQPDKLNDIWVIALNGVQWIILAAGYIALIMIIAGGFRYMTSQGDSSRVTAAKGMILHAVIGLVIALAAVIIARTVQNVINGGII